MILLIEPDLVLAKIYSNALNAVGYEITFMGQAQSAILALDAQLPDLIILEPQLVGHSGIEFLYELRSYADLQNIPVLMHSFVQLEAFNQSREVLRTLNVVGYLYKPQTSLQQLITLVQTMPKLAIK
ncbi:MAG: response regulator [Candidatus Saccharibacteria bacterium]